MTNGFQIKKNKIIDFTKEILLSYAAILFCSSRITGFIFLLATFVDIKSGFLGIIGAASSVFFARRMKIADSIIRTGIFGCSGILIGLSWGHYFNINLIIILLLVVASYFSNKFILYLINELGLKFKLPSLSISFVVFAWIGIIIFKLSNFSSNGTMTLFFIKHLENNLVNIVPFYIQVICKTISFTFFQNSVLVGLLAFFGIFINSRISFSFAALSGFLVYFILHWFKFSGHQISYLGFNSIFAALAFGGFFLRLSAGVFVFTFMAVLATLFMSWVINFDLSYVGLPLLASSFNLTALLFLIFLKANPHLCEKLSLQLVPLDKIKNPEKNLKLACFKKFFDISFPFYGIWKVSQGNNGRYTHKGIGRYAWDFWVIDGKGSTFAQLGLKTEDYYSFNLPIIAPCSGKIVKTVNNIPDNPVGRPNDNFPWGNYVIIEHEGAYVEISHFKCESILVKKNDNVTKGQILGKCGNSGRSYQPHIHFQVQTEPFAGAETRFFKFINFIKLNNEEEIIELNKIPKEGDLVKNFGDGLEAIIDSRFINFNADTKAMYAKTSKNKAKCVNWRIFRRKNKCVLRQNLACYDMQEKDNFLLFNARSIFVINSLSRFLFGFYKIPKYLKINTVWILEENNSKWSVFKPPFIGRDKNIVKNKYLGREKILINGNLYNTHKFNSTFIINKDVWLKETYLAENIGLVKMLIYKNDKIFEEMELK